MKLSIIIPAYNEEKRILPTLNEYYSFFNEIFKNDFEIIVVPNNCSDGTLELVEKFIKNKNQMKILNIPGYVGKGGAVMKGFEIAKGDYIGFTDADNSIDAKNFYKLYQSKDSYDGVIASRKTKGAIVYPPRKVGQNFSSFLFNIVVRILFNLNYHDTQCGAKLFKKNIIKILVKNYSEPGWIFDVDLLYLCKKRKFSIYECPIVWKDYEGSKLTFKQGVRSFFELIAYRMHNF